MQSNRRISLSLGRVVNDGNFGSYRVEVHYETDISEDANVYEEYGDIEDILLSELDKALYKVYRKDE